MGTRRLEVELIGDDRSFQAMLRRSGRNVGVLERNFGRTGRSADQFFRRTGAAARAATPYVAGFAVLGLGKAVAEAREAEKAGNQTRAVIKSMGGAANVSAREVESLAEAIGVKAGMDDEAIQQGENLLLTFANIRNEAGKGNKVFDRTTSLAVDMSVALGQDLSSSAIQLGKALNDPAVGLTALRRVGVSFNEQQTEQIQKLFESGKQLEAQKLILRELSKEFKGSAAAQADSFDRIKVVAENYAEAIGERVLPTLEEYALKASEILSDKSLSGEEKAEKLAALFEKAALEGIDRLAEAAPAIAKAGGRIGVQMIGGFAKAWLESDLLGKLFLGGLLIRTLGGPGAFGKLGGSIGRRIGSRMATTVATETAAAAATGNLFGLGGAGGRTAAGRAGAKWGKWLGVGVVAAGTAYVATHFDEVGNMIDPKDAFVPGGAGDREEFRDSLSEWGLETAGFIGKQKVRVATAWGDLIFNAKTQRVVTAKGKELQGLVGKSVERVVTSLSQKTEKSKKPLDRLGRNFWGLDKQITKSLENIRGNVNKGLGGFGAQKLQFHLLNPEAPVGVSGPVRPGNQRGGYAATVPGSGSGDKVLTQFWAEPGEDLFVLNRSASRERRSLMAWNQEHPRFQKGGFPRPVLGGAGGPLRELGQGGIDEVYAAGLAYLKKHQPAAGGGVGGYTGPPANFAQLGNNAWVDAHTLAVQAYLNNRFGTSTSSTWRSIAHNAAVGGVEGSLHTHGSPSNPGAIDSVPASGALLSFARKHIAGLEEGMIHDAGSGLHNHLGFFQRGGRVPPPKHGSRWLDPGSNVSVDEGATLLWQAGLPLSVAAQLARYIPGESGGRINAIGPATSNGRARGWLQVMMPLHQAIVNRYGGDVLNPATHALTVADIWRDQGYGAWEASPSGPAGRILRGRIVSPWELLKQKRGPFKRQRDAVNYLMKRGISKADAQRNAAAFIARRGTAGEGKGGGDAGGGGGGGGTGSSAGLGNLTGLSFEDQLSLLDVAGTKAQGTPGSADDVAVISRRIKLLAARDRKVVNRIRQLSKQLAKAPKKRREALRQKRSELLSEHASLTGDIAALHEEQTGVSGGDESTLAAEIKALREELERNRKVAEAELAVGLVEAKRALADIISGELGGFVDQQRRTAGAGSARDY